jgi:phage-related minor tail protein
MPDLVFDVKVNDHGAASKVKQTATAFEGLSDASKRLQEAQVKVKAANQAGEKATLDLAAAQRRLTATMQDTTASGEDQRRASLKVEQAELAQTKAALTLAKANERVESSGDGVEKSFHQVSGAQALLLGAVGGASAKLAELTAGAGQQLLAQVGSSRALIQAQLGLTAQDAGRYAKLAGKLYSENYGGSLDEVVGAISAVRQAQQQLQVTSSVQLKQISGDVLNVADTWGLDLNQVIDATGKIMTNRMAPDARSALDAVIVGLQGGANQAGDLLDTLTEYPPQFAKLGIDASQGIGLMNQGLKAGARNTDIIADAFKEFSIRSIDGSKLTGQGFRALGLDADVMGQRIAKGGKSANDALQLTLERLRGIPDPVARGQAAVALFGTQAEDLGATLFALDPATAKLANVAGAAERLGEALGSSPQAKVTAFFRSMQQRAVEAGAATIDAFGNVSPTVAQAGLAVVAAGLAFKGAGAISEKVGTQVGNLKGNMKALTLEAVGTGARMAGVSGALFLLTERLQAAADRAQHAVEVTKAGAGDDIDAQLRALQEGLKKAEQERGFHVNLGVVDLDPSWNGAEQLGKVDQYKKAIQELTDRKEIDAVASGVAAKGNEQIGASAKGATVAIVEEKSALESLNDSLDAGLNPRLDMIKAQVGFKDSLASLTESVKSNSEENKRNAGSLDDNSVAGRANRTALVNAVEAAKALAQANAGLGGSMQANQGVLATSIAKIRESAKAAGMNKAEVDKLIASIYKIPKGVTAKTAVETAGAQIALARLQASIRQVKGKTVVVQVAQSGVQRVQREISAITGRAVSITVGGGPTALRGNAEGTRNWRGGWTLVGEEGPELANLPRGTDIYSNGESRGMLARPAPAPWTAPAGDGGRRGPVVIQLVVDGRVFAQSLYDEDYRSGGEVSRRLTA